MRIFLAIIAGLLGSSYGLSEDSAYDVVDSTPVTEQQEADGEVYIHQGLASERYKEMCLTNPEKYKDICDEDKKAFDGGSNQKLELLLPALTKAYSMFTMMGGGGGGFDATVQNSQGQTLYNVEGKKELVPIADGQKVPEGATAKTETKTDYCGYITMVSEAATTAYTALQNQKTEQNFQGSKPEARQAASFYAIADSHKTMAKSAKVQYQVWTGTAACYTAYALQATYQGDWKVYAKLAASVFIASYYKKKEKAHKEREKILNQMAQELPQAGECNPFTNRSCFCAEESSLTADPANYQKFCTPQALANRNATGDAFVCVDANKNIDAQCKCASSNNCIDKRLKIAGINLGLNPTVLKDPLATLKPISSGFGSAGLNAAAARNLALATKTLKSFKPKKPVSLNNAQKEIAKSLFKNGIPKSSAAYLSKVKTTPKASSLVKSSGFSGGRLNSRSAKTKRIASKKGKFQIGSSGARKSNRRSGNPFSRYKKKSKRASNSPYIEDFAKKAERKAEITNDHSKRIFDIISYRYKMSTWKDFLPKSTE